MLSYMVVCAGFSLLLCWPSLYRLYLPANAGTLLYYVVAYLVPFVAGLLLLFETTNATRRVVILLAISFVLTFSISFSQGGGQTASMLFFAIKFYLTPIMLLWLGFHFGRRLGAERMLPILALIAGGHLLFSLVYFYDILPNPVYSGEGDFRENWTTTAGSLRAFLGLTLSKFDLAYQLGFMIIALVLNVGLFRRRGLYWYTIIVSAWAVAFTYNKTIFLLIALTIMACVYRRLEARARTFAVATLGVGLAATGYVIALFLSGELPLVDLLIFMSPQTFWSRVEIWDTVASFGWPNVLFGRGAGSMIRADETVDNQYLFAYLEMGALGALSYFGLLFACIKNVASHSRNFLVLLFLLGLTFLIGDILHALTVMYVIGLSFGWELYEEKATTAANLSARAR